MKLRFKYGLKMLFRNPVRIAASFLAAIIALGIAGMCIFMQTYNIIPWAKELFFGYSGYNGTVEPYIALMWTNGDSPEFSEYNFFSEEQLLEAESIISDIGGYAIMFQDDRDPPAFVPADLQYYVNASETRFWGEHDGETLFAPYPRVDSDMYFGTSQEDEVRRDIYKQLYRQITVYSGEDAMEAFGYTLVGSLPEKEDEVAVPQWLYNCFLCYGYRSEDGTVYEVDSEKDIIGKTLKLYWGRGSYPIASELEHEVEAEIVGVVHTDYEKEQFPERAFAIKRDLPETAPLTIENYYRYNGGTRFIDAPHMGLVVSREALLSFTYDEFTATHIVVPRYQSYSETYFNLFYRPDEVSTHEFYPITGGPRLQIAETHSVKTLDFTVQQIYADTAIYFQIVPYLGVFAALLLIYLCFSTVMGKRRGVGIMQSMGANKWQMILTIGVPILLFCLLCSVGALCVELVFLSYMNGRLDVTIETLVEMYDYSAVGLPYPFTLGWETWLFTFGVPLLIAAVTTLVTVWLVFRTPVVDNLNKKDFRLFRKKVKTNPFTDHPWSGA